MKPWKHPHLKPSARRVLPASVIPPIALLVGIKINATSATRPLPTTNHDRRSFASNAMLISLAVAAFVNNQSYDECFTYENSVHSYRKAETMRC